MKAFTSQGMYEATKGDRHRTALPWCLQREHGPAVTMASDVWPLEGALREYISVVISHPICGALLQKP